MKISGIAGTVLLGFAALFKIMHWPGAGIMMTLGALTLAFIFMPSALTVLWKETHSRKRLFLYLSAFFAGMFFIMGVAFKVQHWPGAGIIHTLAGLSGIICFIPALLASKLKDQQDKSKRIIYILGATGLVFYFFGLLCKVQHWPGALILLTGGLLITFFVVFPWYTRHTWKEDNFVSARFIFMVIGTLVIIVPSTLVALNLQRSYEEGFYISQQQQQAVYSYKFQRNQAFYANHKDSVPVLTEIYRVTNDLIGLIDQIDSKMIAESEGTPEQPAAVSQLILQTENGPEIQFGMLKRPFNPLPFTHYLQKGSVTRSELDEALKHYAGYISGLTPDGELKKYEPMLEPSSYFTMDNADGKPVSLMSGLHKTALLKTGILTVESCAFSEVSKH